MDPFTKLYCTLWELRMREMNARWQFLFGCNFIDLDDEQEAAEAKKRRALRAFDDAERRLVEPEGERITVYPIAELAPPEGQ